MFVGREKEMAQLARIVRLKKASLVVCRGRRRIGKSTLIQLFGQRFPRFFEFQGLAPRDSISNLDQLKNFSRQLAVQLDLPPLTLRTWSEAFALLAAQTEKGKTLIFLDEISWMASRDKDFVGQLKIAWDTRFKKNKNLMLVLCGSVSSWIDKNILNSADFVGRISLSIDLKELPLRHCHQFWGKHKARISAFEKFRILSVVGGVPRYLEEVDYTQSAEHNITELLFQKNGMLFNEFDRIFNDIFTRRSANYREVVNALVGGSRSFSEICETIGVAQSGVVSDYLTDLVSSDFIARDYVFSLKSGKRGRLSKYRIRDNYLRFYLKYVEPIRDQIQAGLYESVGVEDIVSYDTLLGLQLETLVLNNIPQLIDLLDIQPGTILSASPYFQNKTTRQQACQIDLLIDTRRTIYVCEIKYRNSIETRVMAEVQTKMQRLKYDKRKSLRTVLIYVGNLSGKVEAEGFFDAILPFERLLED